MTGRVVSKQASKQLPTGRWGEGSKGTLGRGGKLGRGGGKGWTKGGGNEEMWSEVAVGATVLAVMA